MRYRKFQIDDCSRIALVPGAVQGWDTGLGKGVAAFTMPLVWLGWHDADLVPTPRSALRIVPRGRVLLVIPGGLHDQISRDGVAKFGIKPVPLPDQSTFLRLTNNGTRRLPDGFYITSYTQLTRNGVAKPSKEIRRDYLSGIGLEKLYGPNQHSIRCVYSPSLSDLSCKEFDCVAVDEGVRLQGGESMVGEGIRRMDPPYRLVLTATPIKNRLQQIFFLIAWSARAREANARFPYNCTVKDQQDFAKKFQVEERNLTKEAMSELEGKKRRFKKLTPEVCSVHELWKLLGNNVLRRRKSDCGEDIVKKMRHVIRVPMGTEQARVYKYHLLANHVDSTGKTTLLPKMTACRVAAANPGSPLLVAAANSRTCLDKFGCEYKHYIQQPRELLDLPHRARHSYTPKVAAALHLLEQILSQPGEQIIFGSAFQDALDALAVYLRQAGIPYELADGRVTEAQRGAMGARFKAKEFPVLLANVESMAEGYDFWQCSNAALLSYSWAWDKFEQFINRIHRLLSPKDVNVWSIICEGTVERKLEESIYEKGDSQELVLDGKLITEPAAELNMADLYDEAVKEFDTATQTIDEQSLLAGWPELRARLAESAKAWSGGKVAAVPPTPANIIPFPVEAALKANPWRQRYQRIT